ncbi:MAG: hypothetical protein AAFV19_06745 [Pseudomonadota bacterium]
MTDDTNDQEVASTPQDAPDLPSGETQLVLHIGAAKTGSSAIQRFIQLNADWLAARDILVPDSRLGMSSKRTGEHVFTLEELFRRQEKERLTTTLTALCDKLNPGQRLLLSGENMSNHGRHAFFEDVAKKHPTEVIFYIRRQDELLTSAWQQWHSKVEEDFNAWLIMALRQYGQWEKLIKDWEGVVGAGRVKIRVFDRGDFPGGDLLKDFLQVLGFDPETSGADFDIGVVNPSYSDIITPLVAGNRNIFKDANDSDFYEVVHELTGESYTKGPKYSLISPRQREKIIEFYKPVNQRVCRDYFPGRARLFPEVDHAKYTYLDDGKLRDLQMRFLTEMAYAAQRRERKNGKFRIGWS